MIKLKSKRKIFLSFSISLCLLVSFLSLHPQNYGPAAPDKGRYTAAEAADQTDSKSVEAEAPIPQPSPNSLTETMQGSGHSSSVSNDSGSLYFTQHLMCKDYASNGTTYDPVKPTTTFRPSDTKAVCLATVFINSTIEFRWFYRDNSSKNWVSCWNYSRLEISPGEYSEVSYLLIAGQWLYCPRAYKVDVYLDYLFSFSEFFEITNAGLNSPRVCQNIENGNPVDMKSRFTIGPVDTKACYYLRFDNMAYFNDETGSSHNFTTVWIQPDGTTYKTYTYAFGDYKDSDTSLNCWENGMIPDDFIFINSSTPVGNWKVEVYMDSYYSNGSWTPYGPIAITPFVVGNTSVPDWTFMMYLDGDNSLENASIDVFLKMASVPSSANVNVIVQFDRAYGYGMYNWTDCKRFKITQDMSLDPQNAVQNLTEVDMGDPKTLNDFLNWTISNYPANSYFLVLWDHGSGCMGVCYDMTNGNDTLTLPELSEAMTGLPVIIDDVLIDACSMTMAEVAYQIKDFANILIGPEGLGYAPAPYDSYLTDLTSNSSISPINFARDIVEDYINWCRQVPDYIISTATMSAIDLTKMTALTEAINDFATTLLEKETLLHEQIGLARNLTTEYEGPYQFQFGYFFDLYSFAEQIHYQIPDRELGNASSEVMSALSIGNTVIAESNKNYADSHGLAIFFPEKEADYDLFKDIYNMIAFAQDTSWGEFVGYQASVLYVLTVQTPYNNMPVKVAEDTYITDDNGKIQLYLSPGSYTVNVPTVFSTAPDVRGVFTKWNDSDTSNLKTFLLYDEGLTGTAEYTSQYRLIMDTDFGKTTPEAGTHWYIAGKVVEINATAPNVTSEQERYEWRGWTQVGLENPLAGISGPINMNQAVNMTAGWSHEYLLTVASQYPDSSSRSSQWNVTGTIIYESVVSPYSAPGVSGTRYYCTGWIGTGSVTSVGVSTVTSFILNASSSIQWNWKTQYLLTINTDPAGLNPYPNVTQEGPWYDNLTTIQCTAQQISGYDFQYWSVDGANWPMGNRTIAITMNAPYDLTAHYVLSQPWWGILARADVISAIFGLFGTVVTVGLVGGTWFRSRKRRDIVKAFLAEIDDIYSRLKTDPKKCEEELHTLRNIILEGLTEGKINEDNYEVLDGRIDKYASELAEKQGEKRRSSNKRAEE